MLDEAARSQKQVPFLVGVITLITLITFLGSIPFLNPFPSSFFSYTDNSPGHAWG
jgi:hypothetical protein